MPFDLGFNFRSTAAYVTDPANTTYVEIETYPTTRGGATFGWLNSPGGNVRNRSVTVDPRIAGVHYFTNTLKNKFRLDLPASGSVDVYCAVGDAIQAGLSGYLEVFDNTSSLGVIVSKRTSVAANLFYDATDTSYSAASWPGSNAKATFTFATAVLVVAVSPGDSVGSSFVLSHLRAVQSASGISLTGDASTQGSAASTAAITQDHVVSGTNAAQANASVGGAITQGHELVGAGSTQGNAASAGAISQTGDFIGANCTQANGSGAAAVTQIHALTGSTSTQSNLAGTGAISQGAVHDLTAGASAQANGSGVAAITQAHVLIHAPSVQDNVASASAIVQAHILAAANCSQGNAGLSDAIVLGDVTLISTVERSAVFRALVARSARFQRSKSVTVKFN